LNWPHYVIPIYHPAFILRQWSERQFSVAIYAKAKEELDYVLKNGVLQPLPQRNLVVKPQFKFAVEYLKACIAAKDPISVDIEKLWVPKQKVDLIYTIALAMSPWDACSFCFWDYTNDELYTILRLLDYLFTHRENFGQNYLAFDTKWLGTLGLHFEPDLLDDTLIRHHVLWPELDHDLGFLTAQYTREPYYKDEGKQWRVGDDKGQLLTYNAKDAAVTYEVWLEQEKEFDGQ